MTTTTITRLVPLGGALSAALAVQDTLDERDDFFATWYVTSTPEAPNGLAHMVALPVEVVESYIATAPPTPVGKAWAAAAQRAVEATKADSYRSFDRLTRVPDAAWTGLVELAGELEALSPLLVPVADALNLMASPDESSLGAYLAMIARLTRDGIDVGRGESARWEHIEAIRPGTEAQIRRLVDAFLAALPEIGPDDVSHRIG